MKKSRRSNRSTYPTDSPGGAVRAASHQELAESAHDPAWMPDELPVMPEAEVVLQIHSLTSVPGRSWVIPGTPERPSFELRVTPLEECPTCRPGTHRDYGLEWAFGLSCECCGEDSLFLLTIAHSLGGKILCAACVFFQGLTGECRHERPEDGAGSADS